MRLSTLVLLLLGTMTLFRALNDPRVDWDMVITWDAAGYYAYLPAVLIYGDLAHMEYHDEIDHKYKPSGKDKKRFALREDEDTGRTIIKFTSGVALLELPFFLLGHAYAHLHPKYSESGYSYPYQAMVVVSTVFYTFLGLWWLLGFLRRHFSEGVALLSVLTLWLGTNLWYYSHWYSGMSHQISFALFAGLFLSMDRWHEKYRWRDAMYMALAMGMIVMIRPTNVFVAVFPLLWWVGNGKEGWRSFWQHAHQWIPLVMVACIPMALQMTCWKEMTGDWLYYSYQHEQFYWDNPQWWNGLWSYRKGWFVYTPLALLGMIVVFVLLSQKEWRYYGLLSLMHFVPLIYVIFCWSSWSYGGSFGCRVLIESLVVFGVPMAWMYQWMSRRADVVVYLMTVLLVCVIMLNILQSAQFRKGTIRWDGMTKEMYWEAFEKLPHSG